MSNTVYLMAFKQLIDHTVHIQGSYEQRVSHYMWTAMSLALTYHYGENNKKKKKVKTRIINNYIACSAFTQ